MARDRNRTRTGDMFRSLAVILVPILAITALLTINLDDYPVEPVDVQPVLAQAREQSPFPVLAPQRLPTDWIPTRVSWVPTGAPDLNDEPSPQNRWLLGYLDPSQTYVAVEQGDGPAQPFVAGVTRDGLAEDVTTVAGQDWQQFVSPDGRTRALVLTTDQVTTVVSGDVGYSELADFTATLASG